MSNLFDEGGDQPFSLFKPVGGGSKKKEEEQLPSLFAMRSKQAQNQKKTPQQQSSKNQQQKPKSSSAQKKEHSHHKKKDDKPPPPPPPSAQQIPQQPQQVQQVQQVQQPVQPVPQKRPKKKIIKQVIVQRKQLTMVGRTLAHLQNQITSQFDELFTIVKGLNTQPPQNPPPQLSNEQILLKLQEAIGDSLDKDRILQMKQSSIAKITKTYTERSERSELRQKVADLMETIAAEAVNTKDAQSEHEYRANEVSRLKIEIENIPKNCDETENKMRMNLTNELKALREDYEKKKKECLERERVAIESIKYYTEQINSDILAKKGPTEADLEKAVDDCKNELKSVVQMMGDTVEEYIGSHISKDKKYSGAIVKKAVMLALKKAHKRITNPEQESDSETLEDEVEEHEEEEEEGEEGNEEAAEEEQNEDGEEQNENEEEQQNEAEEEQNEAEEEEQNEAEEEEEANENQEEEEENNEEENVEEAQEENAEGEANQEQNNENVEADNQQESETVHQEQNEPEAPEEPQPEAQEEANNDDDDLSSESGTSSSSEW